MKDSRFSKMIKIKVNSTNKKINKKKKIRALGAKKNPLPVLRERIRFEQLKKAYI